MKTLVKFLGYVFVSSCALPLAVDAAPVPPDQLPTMQMLYGATYQKNGQVVSVIGEDSKVINECVKPWKTADIVLGGVNYFIATGQGAEVTNPSDSAQPCEPSHADPAYISAIWFSFQGGKWVALGKALNFTADGSWGNVNGGPWSPFPQMANLIKNTLLVADEGGYSNMGVSTSWYPIFAFSPNGLVSLGNIPSGMDDRGTGSQPVNLWNGKIVAASLSPIGMPKITLLYNGVAVVNNQPVKLKNTSCTFVYEMQAGDQQHPGFKLATPECAAIFESE